MVHVSTMFIVSRVTCHVSQCPYDVMDNGACFYTDMKEVPSSSQPSSARPSSQSPVDTGPGDSDYSDNTVTTVTPILDTQAG